MGADVKHDSLGKIFRVEKRLGRGDEFEVISHFPDGKVQISSFHHEDCDGLGALLMESTQWEGAHFQSPLFRVLGDLRFKTLLEGMKGFLDDFVPSKTLWKHLDVDALYTPKNLAWRVLDEESTGALLRYARKKTVSLNSLLLSAVNSAVADFFLKDEQIQCRWLIPVNMRRNPEEALSSANHTSSVGMKIERSDSPEKIDRVFRKSLNKWRVLFAHRLANIVSHLDEDLLFQLAKKRGEKNFWIGSFSNLGLWNFPEAVGNKRWPWAISIAPPAGTPCFPVGVGVVTWQGHLSISLRLHAGLMSNEANIAESVLASICDSLSKWMNSEMRFLASSETQELG